MSLPLILCLLAIVASIVIGYKFKFNTGVIALAFAFIIGNLVMGLKVNDIVAFWPTTIVFYLLSIALFFNYATENGTMDVLGKKLLYAMGGNAKLIPLAIAAVSAIVGGLGAGASTPAIVGPFCFVMALSAGCDPVLTAVAITFGNLLAHHRADHAAAVQCDEHQPDRPAAVHRAGFRRGEHAAVDLCAGPRVRLYRP